MRGVIALAAAISLPVTLADGSRFPQRNLIIFLTFCVILVTLVLQVLTLPAVIRALGLTGSQGYQREEEEARRVVLEDALAYLEQARRQDRPEFAAIYTDLEEHYRHWLAALTGAEITKGGIRPEHYVRFLELSRELLGVERRSALRLRNEGHISHDVLRQIAHELDLGEARLGATGGA